MMKVAVHTTIFICLTACGNNPQQKQTNEWAGTIWHQLEGENIKLRIPKQLKKSSRYRIKEDLPTLAKDSAQLRLAQNSLELLEFKDSKIDVFVDTTKSYRMIIICNTARIDFNKTDATIVKKQMKADNENKALSNPTLEFGEIIANLKTNQNHKMAKYTTQIKNMVDNGKVYHTIYYLTGDFYTLFVYEFSQDEDSIEKYLWTTKAG